MVSKSEVEGGESAHGEAGDVRLVDAQVIEHCLDVVGGQGLRIRRGALGHIRWRITASVERNGTVAPAKVSQLQLPTSKVACEFVYEDQRRARSGLFVEEAD